MIVKFLGSGLSDLLVERPKDVNMEPSILVNRKILVDATPSISKQLSSTDKIEAVFITHAQRDAVAGLKEVPKFSLIEEVPVYMPKHTLDLVMKEHGQIKGLKYVEVKFGELLDILDLQVTAIPVEHSVLQQKYDPTVAWKIENFLYCPNIDQEFFFSDRAKSFWATLKEVETVILNGALTKSRDRGHLNLMQVANHLNSGGYNNVFFTQTDLRQTQFEVVKDSLKKINKTYDIAFDGQTIEINNKQNLIQNLLGLNLAQNHAKMLWQGNKSLILKAKDYPNAKGKLFYVVGGNEAYGVIRITDIQPIDEKGFTEKANEHRITSQEKELWWPGKQKLFAYEFKIVRKFEQPQLVESTSPLTDLVDEVKFLSEIAKRERELSGKLGIYSPVGLDLAQLETDFRIGIGWHNNYVKGNLKDVEESEIKQFLKPIITELTQKNSSVFNTDLMDVQTKTFFNDILAEVIKVNAIKHKDTRIPEYAYSLSDSIIFKDVVSIVGPVVEGKKSDSVNMHISLAESDPKLRSAMEIKIAKMLPDVLMDKLAFSWGATNSCSKEIPLYDLILKKHDVISVIDHNASQVFLFEDIKSMKPIKKFVDIQKALNYLYGGG